MFGCPVHIVLCFLCSFLIGGTFYRLDPFHAVHGKCKVSGVSIMAKSLFTSRPHQKSKKEVDSQQQNDDFVVKESNNFHLLGNNQGQFHEFLKAYSSPTHSRINIGLDILKLEMDKYQRCYFNLKICCSKQ